jgi:hypothetical protein
MCLEFLPGRGCSPLVRGPLSKINKTYYLYYKYVQPQLQRGCMRDLFFFQNETDEGHNQALHSTAAPALKESS